MGQAIPLSQREQIVSLHETGKTLQSIALDLGLSYSGVRQIWKRYQAHGLSGLADSYSNCGRCGPQFSALIVRATCWLKRLNPDCGAPLIHFRLSQRYPDQPIPSIRTMQVWFVQQKLQKPKRSFPPRESSMGQIRS